MGNDGVRTGKSVIPGQLHRFCVFCGQEPKSKTREHILPKWLIRLTGNEHRTICTGLDKSKVGQRLLSALSFSFPACQTCNTKYSTLEQRAQHVVASLLSNHTVQEDDFSCFLDWIDKIRVGLWLSDMIQNPDSVKVKRKFHISQRIRKCDRCIFICRTDEDAKRVSFFGTYTPLFHLAPSCFGLVINNIYLISISDAFLFGHRLGLPTLKDRLWDEETDGISGVLTPGKNRIKLPLIKFDIHKAYIGLYQPCFPDNLSCDPSFAELLDTDYAKSVLFDGASIGKIFTADGHNAFAGSKARDFSMCTRQYSKECLLYTLKRTVLKTQIELASSPPEYGHWSPNKRRFTRALLKSAIRYNRLLLRKIEEQASQVEPL